MKMQMAAMVMTGGYDFIFLPPTQPTMNDKVKADNLFKGTEYDSVRLYSEYPVVSLRSF
jgi:hypothetical protein